MASIALLFMLRSKGGEVELFTWDSGKVLGELKQMLLEVRFPFTFK
jgi:hypothetical protein